MPLAIAGQLNNCDVIVKKANRRLYAIRKLKGARVKENDLVAVYCSLIRSILEYGSVAFAHLPNYLSNTLEGIQKRALSILYFCCELTTATTMSTTAKTQASRAQKSYSYS